MEGSCQKSRVAIQIANVRSPVNCSPRLQPNQLFLRLFLLFALFVCCGDSVVAQVLYANDFEDDPVGTYSVSNLAADWNSPSWNDGVDEGRVSIANDADAYGDKSLVVKYNEGGTTDSKSQWQLDFDQGYEELFLTYRIRFDENFDFVRGGKLPGLAGGAANTGGNKPNGTDGWSARMMWRTDGSGGSSLNPDEANLVQYLYHPDQPTNFGHDQKWDDGSNGQWKKFESDQWYHMQHRVVMNTPGQDDGILQAWFDGEMVLDVQDIRYRDTASLQIDMMYFSTFFGGSSSIWEATKDELAYFDDFVVSTDFITIPGDYNSDGVVDAADFTVWRDAFGAAAGALPNDFDGGTIGQAQYNTWAANFGNAVDWANTPLVTAVPEPQTLPFAWLCAASLVLFGRRRSRKR